MTSAGLATSITNFSVRPCPMRNVNSSEGFFSALPMTKAWLPAFIQASAFWASVDAGRHVSEVTAVFVPAAARENSLWREAATPIKKYKPEQMVTLLRQIEVEIANGTITPSMTNGTATSSVAYRDTDMSSQCRWLILVIR